MVKVAHGKNGWLFLDNDTNEVMRQVTGERRLSSAEVQRWKAVIQRRKRLLAKLGTEYHILVAPNKHAVYPEHLPDHIKPYGHGPAQQLLDDGIPLLYPLNRMLADKKNTQLYQATDTHWNDYGALIGAQALLKSLQLTVSIPEASQFQWKEQTCAGDLGGHANPQQHSKRAYATRPNRPASMVFTNQLSNRGHAVVYEQADASLPRALLFADSFAFAGLIPILADSFSQLVCVHSAMVDFELVRRIRPHVVLSQYIERFLVQPPLDGPPFRLYRIIKRGIRWGKYEDWRLEKMIEAFSENTKHAEMLLGPGRRKILMAYARRALAGKNLEGGPVWSSMRSFRRNCEDTISVSLLRLKS